MRELRRLRKQLGWSQLDLAAQSGVSQYTITELETGRRKDPRPSTLRKLAKALNVEPKELITPQKSMVEAGGARASVRVGGASVQATPIVEAWVKVPSDIAQALRGGKQLDLDELRELQESVRAQLTAK